MSANPRPARIRSALRAERTQAWRIEHTAFLEKRRADQAKVRAERRGRAVNLRTGRGVVKSALERIEAEVHPVVSLLHRAHDETMPILVQVSGRLLAIERILWAAQGVSVPFSDDKLEPYSGKTTYDQTVALIAKRANLQRQTDDKILQELSKLREVMDTIAAYQRQYRGS